MLSEDIVKKLLNESEIEYMDFSNGNSAFGIYIENAVFVFHDAQMCVKSYPDTGVFLLLKGSYTASSDNKYQEYILEGKTIKNIIFQSRNAAAQFVLGDTGQTNSWKFASKGTVVMYNDII